jgi:sugar phosphate isomerase/epimerase
MRLDQIALQLYTVRRLAADDLPGTLRAVAAAGYRSVEIAGLPETPGHELRELLDGAGLQAIAAHVGIDQIRAGSDSLCDWLDEIRCRRVIVPWLPEDERRTADDVRRFANELNERAAALSVRGIRLGYHNHDFEFVPLDGTTVWDVLVGELAPQVDIELDVFWTSIGGRNPVAVIDAVGGRIRLLHMKDRAPGSVPRDAPAGEGTLAMAEIVDAGDRAGVEWYIAEQDEPHAVLRDIASAYDHLADLASGPS